MIPYVSGCGDLGTRMGFLTSPRFQSRLTEHAFCVDIKSNSKIVMSPELRSSVKVEVAVLGSCTSNVKQRSTKCDVTKFRGPEMYGVTLLD